jgi:hypothetical protein
MVRFSVILPILIPSDEEAKAGARWLPPSRGIERKSDHTHFARDAAQRLGAELDAAPAERRLARLSASLARPA